MWITSAEAFYEILNRNCVLVMNGDLSDTFHLVVSHEYMIQLKLWDLTSAEQQKDMKQWKIQAKQSLWESFFSQWFIFFTFSFDSSPYLTFYSWYFRFGYRLCFVSRSISFPKLIKYFFNPVDHLNRRIIILSWFMTPYHIFYL